MKVDRMPGRSTIRVTFTETEVRRALLAAYPTLANAYHKYDVDWPPELFVCPGDGTPGDGISEHFNNELMFRFRPDVVHSEVDKLVESIGDNK